MTLTISANRAAAVGNEIISCGDYSSLDIVLGFNTLLGRWQTLSAYQPARHTAVVAFDRSIYAIGGNTQPSGSFLDTIQVIQPPA